MLFNKIKLKNYLLIYYNIVYLDIHDNIKNNKKFYSGRNYIVCYATFGSYFEKFPKLFWLVWNILKFLMPVIIFFQVFYLLFISIFKNLFIKKRNVNLKRLIILTHFAVLKTGKRIGFFTEDDYFLNRPFKKYNIDKSFKTINFFELTKIYSIIINFFYTLYCIPIVIIRFGYKNLLYVLNSYEWFLLYDTLNSLPITTEIVYSNQKDRWAVLFDKCKLPNKTLIQHGTNMVKLEPSDKIKRFYKYDELTNYWTLNMLYKTNNIRKLYCFSELERRHMLLGEQKCNPDFFLIGYNIKLTERTSNIFTILLVCNYTYFGEVEEFLIKNISRNNVELLVKSHPLVDASIYNLLIKDYNFKIVEKNTFPDADIVCSYDSTLAYEYESLGKKVYYFSNDLIDAQKLLSSLYDEFKKYIKNS